MAIVFELEDYGHPGSHPPSIITQDADNRFVTDAQIADWDAKATTAEAQAAIAADVAQVAADAAQVTADKALIDADRVATEAARDEAQQHSINAAASKTTVSIRAAETLASKNAAEAAQTGAETAQGLAEDAQTAAEVAQAAAEAAESTANNYAKSMAVLQGLATEVAYRGFDAATYPPGAPIACAGRVDGTKRVMLCEDSHGYTIGNHGMPGDVDSASISAFGGGKPLIGFGKDCVSSGGFQEKPCIVVTDDFRWGYMEVFADYMTFDYTAPKTGLPANINYAIDIAYNNVTNTVLMVFKDNLAAYKIYRAPLLGDWTDVTGAVAITRELSRIFCVDPALGIWIAYNVEEQRFWRSTDDGLTWGAPISLSDTTWAYNVPTEPMWLPNRGVLSIVKWQGGVGNELVITTINPDGTGESTVSISGAAPSWFQIHSATRMQHGPKKTVFMPDLGLYIIITNTGGVLLSWDEGLTWEFYQSFGSDIIKNNTWNQAPCKIIHEGTTKYFGTALFIDFLQRSDPTHANMSFACWTPPLGAGSDEG